MPFAKEIMQVIENSRSPLIKQISYTLINLTAFALPISTTATDFLFPLATAFSLFNIKWRTLFKFPYPHPVALLMIIFFLSSIIGTVYSIAPWHDILHQLSRTACLFMAALLMLSLDNDRIKEYTLNAFLLAMLITLFLSYVKYFFMPEILHNRFITESADVFKDHIIQNYLMAFAAFIFIHRWLNRYPFRNFYAIIIMLMVYNILFLNNGRSGYFIFAILLIYSFITHFGWRGFLGGLLTLFILSMLAFSFSKAFRQRIVSIEENIHQYQHGQNYTPVGERLESMRNAYLLFKREPWLGHGTGSLYTVYHSLPKKDRQVGVLHTSYNEYLNVTVELGIVGLALLITILFTQWRYSLYLTGEWRHITQALLISIIFGCMANAWLSDTTELHLYALFVALGFSGVRSRNHFENKMKKRVSQSSVASLPPFFNH